LNFQNAVTSCQIFLEAETCNILFFSIKLIVRKKQERKLTSASRSLYTLAVIFVKFKNTKNDIPNSIYTYPSLCVGDTFQKNTTQIETTQSELGFSIANRVKFEDGFQRYKNTTF